MFLWFFMFAIYIDLCFIYNIFISSHTHTHMLVVGKEECGGGSEGYW